MDSQKLLSAFLLCNLRETYSEKKIEIESPAEAFLTSFQQFGWHVTVSKLILIAGRALGES